MAKAHKDPAARKHFWEHPASEHDPYPDPPPAASAEYPQHLHKLDGSWKEVKDAGEYQAAVEDGYIPHQHLNEAKRRAADASAA